MIVVGKRR
jgi:hypothetical protein